MRRWPLRHRVIVNADTGGIDYSNTPGAELLESGLWSVPVYAWELAKSEKQLIEGSYVVSDHFRIYAPPGRFANAQHVGNTEQLGWIVQGSPIDHNNGPGWKPGLVIYVATRTVWTTW